MQEVLKKVNELYTLLEEKEKELDERALTLKEEIARQEDAERKLTAAQNNISARERVCKAHEDIETKMGLIKKNAQDVASKQVMLEEKEASLIMQEKELVNQKKELEKMMATFKKKNAAVDALKVDLDKRKKKLKAEVLEEIGKQFNA